MCYTRKKKIKPHSFIPQPVFHLLPKQVLRLYWNSHFFKTGTTFACSQSTGLLPGFAMSCTRSFKFLEWRFFGHSSLSSSKYSSFVMIVSVSLLLIAILNCLPVQDYHLSKTEDKLSPYVGVISRLF